MQPRATDHVDKSLIHPLQHRVDPCPGLQPHPHLARRDGGEVTRKDDWHSSTFSCLCSYFSTQIKIITFRITRGSVSG